jgi:hypothetical protein
MTKFFSILLILLLGIGGLYLIGLGTERWWAQHVAITSWPSVPGVVTSSQMTTSRGSKGSTNYHAEISYSYWVSTLGSQPLRSTKLLAIGDSHDGDYDTAARRLALFPLNASIKVYHHPGNARDSFILNDYQCWPMAVTNGGFALLACGAWCLFRNTRTRQTTEPVDDGWVLLRPCDTIAEISGSWTAFAGVSVLLVPPIITHAVVAPSDQLEIGFWIVGGISALWLGFTMFNWLRVWRAARAFNEPEVFLSPPSPAIGEPLTLMIDAPLRPGVEGTASATLICESVRTVGSGKSRREIRDRLFTFEAAQSPNPGPNAAPPSLLIDTILPPSVPLSTPTVSGSRIEWRLDIKLTAGRRVKHTAKYPLEVREAP